MKNVFDDEIFFEGYKQLRENKYSANNIDEKPALFALLPELNGKDVLDLGCGFGENCAEFMRLGANSAVGIDCSEKMLAVARREYPDIRFIHGDMTSVELAENSVDVVCSSLAVHYVEDFGAFAKKVFDCLRPGGYFVFSQEHPLTTATKLEDMWERDGDGNFVCFRLSDYSVSGHRSVSWFIEGVEKYHRTFADIVNSLTAAGFMLEKMAEPVPSPENLKRDPSLIRNYHKPNFLLMRAKRPLRK